LIAAT